MAGSGAARRADRARRRTVATTASTPPTTTSTRCARTALDLRMRTPLTRRRPRRPRTVATDALVLALYHLYGGKVDPLKLSSQWNFVARPIERGACLRVLHGVLATGQHPRSARRGAAAARLVPARPRTTARISRDRGGGRLAGAPGRTRAEAGHERCARTGAAQTRSRSRRICRAAAATSHGCDRLTSARCKARQRPPANARSRSLVYVCDARRGRRAGTSSNATASRPTGRSDPARRAALNVPVRRVSTRSA